MTVYILPLGGIRVPTKVFQLIRVGVGVTIMEKINAAHMNTKKPHLYAICGNLNELIVILKLWYSFPKNTFEFLSVSYKRIVKNTNYLYRFKLYFVQFLKEWKYHMTTPSKAVKPINIRLLLLICFWQIHFQVKLHSLKIFNEQKQSNMFVPDRSRLGGTKRFL